MRSSKKNKIITAVKMSLLYAGSFLWVVSIAIGVASFISVTDFGDDGVLSGRRVSLTYYSSYDPTPTPGHVCIMPMSAWEYVPPALLDHDEDGGSSSYSIQDRFNDELALVPSSDMDYIKSRGWTIELTDMNLAAAYGYSGSIVGITDYETKTVYIANKWSAIRRATIHEIGHALDNAHGTVSCTSEFKSIYYSERYDFHDCTSVGDGHETSDVIEYFASVYQNMILNYDATKSDVPETVAYIERVLWGRTEGAAIKPTPCPTATPVPKPAETVVIATTPQETTLTEPRVSSGEGPDGPTVATPTEPKITLKDTGPSETTVETEEAA